MRLTLTIESPTLTMAKNMGVHKKTDLKSVFSLVINDLRLSLAEAVRFELTNGCPLPVFKTGAIDHSATPPRRNCSSILATGARSTGRKKPAARQRVGRQYQSC